MSSVAIASLNVHPLRPVVVRPGAARVQPLPRVPTACSSCGLRELCLPCGLVKEDLTRVDELVYSRRRVKRGEHLYRAGDPFHALYAFRTGFFKSYIQTADGRTHVTGFQMAGDVVGLDGIESGQHKLDVVALEDGEVCVIPYAELEALASRTPALQKHLHRLMSREIVREQAQLMLLGTMRAESRVAAFLLNLARRFASRGYSATEFNLRMTREEIGSYLGLKLETVSRIFSRFQERGLISAQNRYVKVLDRGALEAVAAEAA
jgi:CRP/FNR family transcriptional regulator